MLAYGVRRPPLVTLVLVLTLLCAGNESKLTSDEGGGSRANLAAKLIGSEVSV
jgi:hypothetical protein